MFKSQLALPFLKNITIKMETFCSFFHTMPVIACTAFINYPDMRGLSTENPINAYVILTVWPIKSFSKSQTGDPNCLPAASSLAQTLVTCWYLQLTGCDTPLCLQPFRGGGGVGEDIQSPTCLNWLQTGFCALVAMETEGRERHEGEMAGKASERQVGSKSTFVFTVSAYSYLPWLSISKGYIRVNIRGRGSHWSWWLITGWDCPPPVLTWPVFIHLCCNRNPEQLFRETAY